MSGGSAFTLAKEPFKFFRNTAMIDYLSTMCGISINTPELDRILETYILFASNTLGDMYHGIWNGLTQSAVKSVSGLYNMLTFNR